MESNEHKPGRRSYDELQADHLVLSNKVEDLQREVVELKEEVAALREDIKGLIEAWKTAKGLTAFVNWLSRLVLGGTAIWAFFHWGPK